MYLMTKVNRMCARSPDLFKVYNIASLDLENFIYCLMIVLFRSGITLASVYLLLSDQEVSA